MKKTNYLESLMNICKFSLGAGIYSIGVAFKSAGVLSGIILVPIVGLIVIYSIHILIDAINIANSLNKTALSVDKTEVDSKNVDHDEVEEDLNYADAVRIIFQNSNNAVLSSISKPMGTFVNCIICIMHMGFGTLFIVFVSRNMKEVLFSFDIDIDQQLLMIIFAIPMWLLSLVPNLKALSPISALANTLVMCCVGISVYYMFKEITTSAVHVDLVGDPTQIPIFFGITLYSFEMISMIVPMRNEMINPKQLTTLFGVLNVGFGVILAFTIFMGLSAYLAYGNNLSDTVLANFPQDEILARSGLSLICLVLILSYPLQIYIPIVIFQKIIKDRYGNLKYPRKYPKLTESAMRTALIIITLIVAESIPFIDLLISLIGAVCSTLTTLLLPSLLNMLIFYPKLKTTKEKVILLSKNGFIILLAAVIFISGLISTTGEIVKEFQQ